MPHLHLRIGLTKSKFPVDCVRDVGPFLLKVSRADGPVTRDMLAMPTVLQRGIRMSVC